MCKDGFLCGESEKVPLDGRSRVDEAAMGNIGSPHNGHSSPKTTQIYTHLMPSSLREAVLRLPSASSAVYRDTISD